MNSTRQRNIINKTDAALICGAVILLALAGCGKKPQNFQMPPQVGFITIQPAPLPITAELPGRIDPVRTAEVRARVAGILLKRNFKEGTEASAIT